MAAARQANETPELLPPQEVVLGEYILTKLPVGDYVLLPQVRDRVHGSLDELASSIAANDLMNQPDVAQMTPAQLDAHLGFINRIWGTKAQLSDYIDRLQPDGFLYVVIAGHSRFAAIKRLEAESQGARRYSVWTKIHHVTSSEEFLALQLAENTYEKPSDERRAMAIVEMYLNGLETGRWTDEDSFLRQKGSSISQSVLRDAIGFARLPAEAREFVFQGKLPYAASVAIGQAAPTVHAFTSARLVASGAESPDFQDAFRREIGLMIEHVYSKRLSARRTRTYVEGVVAGMNQVLERIRAESEGREYDQPSFEGFETPPAEMDLLQQKLYMRGLRSRYASAMARVAITSITAVDQLLALHRRLYGEEGMDRLREELRARYVQFGDLAVGGPVDAIAEQSGTGRLVIDDRI